MERELHMPGALAHASSTAQPCAVIWLTGLSGSGKSTVAQALHQHFLKNGQHSFILDGDVVRTGLCRDLGFDATDRTENIRRIAEVAKLFTQAGVIPIVAAISPYLKDRQTARAILPKEQFLEVHMDVPLSICEQRDPKGLYARARRGELPGFTGIDAPYEPPPMPELRLPTQDLTLSQCVEKIVTRLHATSSSSEACSAPQ